MSKALLHHRMELSAQDFWVGVRPSLEKQFKATIIPVEQLQATQAIKAFDQAGIDAFYLDKQGNPRGLGSRVNYSRFKESPSFTFRYGLWNSDLNDWDRNREYQRKLEAAYKPDEFLFFPKLHVESFCQSKGSGLISWAYVANTKDILNYIQKYLPSQDRRKVYTFEPNGGERREVVVVSVEAFAKDYTVNEVKIKC